LQAKSIRGRELGSPRDQEDQDIASDGIGSGRGRCGRSRTCIVWCGLMVGDCEGE
jgi:hypothetical protein